MFDYSKIYNFFIISEGSKATHFNNYNPIFAYNVFLRNYADHLSRMTDDITAGLESPADPKSSSSSQSPAKNDTILRQVHNFQTHLAGGEDETRFSPPIPLNRMHMTQNRFSPTSPKPPMVNQIQMNEMRLHPGILKRRYTKRQIEILDEKYRVCAYLNREEMSGLAAKTGLTMIQVKIWFQNRRLKDRKKINKNVHL